MAKILLRDAAQNLEDLEQDLVGQNTEHVVLRVNVAAFVVLIAIKVQHARWRLKMKLAPKYHWTRSWNLEYSGIGRARPKKMKEPRSYKCAGGYRG